MAKEIEIYRLADILTQLEVPLVGSQVPAGFASPALDFSEEPIDFNKMLIKDKEATFVAIVKGNSLIEAHVVPGSYLVIDRSIIPNSGDMIVATVFGDFTAKFFKVEGQRIWLLPANKDYQPLEINECHEFCIWGVITRIIINPKQIY